MKSGLPHLLGAWIPSSKGRHAQICLRRKTSLGAYITRGPCTSNRCHTAALQPTSCERKAVRVQMTPATLFAAALFTKHSCDTLTVIEKQRGAPSANAAGGARCAPAQQAHTARPACSPLPYYPRPSAARRRAYSQQRLKLLRAAQRADMRRRATTLRLAL